ncbi:hypothetical protein CW368_10735 [Actinomycetales bacterium SN12]|nr:hypothetical protein CW368_10735 [Actinomycetales bacterium SN12]
MTEARTVKAGIAPLSAPSDTYCTSPGVYSLDESVGVFEPTSLVRDSEGADAGTQEWGTGALAISSTGHASYSVGSNSSGGLFVNRLRVGASWHERVYTSPAAVTNLGNPAVAAVKRVGSADYLYFGTFSRVENATSLELFALIMDKPGATSPELLGQVARVVLKDAGSASNYNAGGDIAFDSQGNMVVLWGSGDSAENSRLYQVAAVPAPASGSITAPRLIDATLMTSGLATSGNEPWNGVAYDRAGALWISQAYKRQVWSDPATVTKLHTVDPSTGTTTLRNTNYGYAANDLASCGSSAPTLTLKTDLPLNRFSATDQFTMDIRVADASTNLAAATTTGNNAGIQSEAAGPTAVAAKSGYTIGLTGATGTDLARYTLTYQCTWTGGTVFVASGTLDYVAGNPRAQASLPLIPGGFDGKALTCTIKATAKVVVMTLRADLVNTRFSAGDQFRLDIRKQNLQTDLAQATTTGATTGVQSPAAGPVNVTAGTVLTIAETGVSGADLQNYTLSYGCTWADGTALVSNGSALSLDLDTGRAQATLPAIPTGRDGQSLVCTVTNTAKNRADVPPRMTVVKNIESRKAGDQFHLAINRTSDNALLGQATTSGAVDGLQKSTVVRANLEQGVVFTISEGTPGKTTPLSGYTAAFVCEWSGGGDLARGMLALDSAGRLQSVLPAIPAGRNGETVTCTITNRASSATNLQCTASGVYAITGAGTTSETTANTVYSVGEDALGAAQFAMGSTANNALAINSDGSRAYAARGSGTGVSIDVRDVGGKTTASVGTLQRQPNTNSADVPATVAGAIDPTTGIYYFGGYVQGDSATLRLFAYAPGAPSVNGNRPYWHALNISIPGSRSTSSNNGDIAFDGLGNLYIAWSPATGTTESTQSVLARVDATLIPRVMPAAVLNVGTAQVAKIATLSSTLSAPINGITFDSKGQLFVSSSGGYKRLDPNTGALIGREVAVSNLVDLAGCGLPPTMRLQKVITARVQAADQFTLQIRPDATSETGVQSATTAGAATGIQSVSVGPTVVTVGKTYTIREVGARSSGTTDAALTKYIAGYTCQWSNATSASSPAVLTSVSNVANALEAATSAIPSTGTAGQQLVCTITNTPVGDATVTVKKTVVDVDGANPAPAAGWSMTATSMTTGRTISDPATKTTGADGAIAAPWTVQGFGDTASLAAVQIAETQQAGYAMVPGSGSGASTTGSRCVITPLVGQPRTVLLTDTQQTLTQIKGGDRVACEFVNRLQYGSVTWQKVDAASRSTFLASSEWSLDGAGVPAGTIVTDCVKATAAECGTGRYADRDPLPGRFKLNRLAHGEFSITETKAPVGFVRDGTRRPFSITPGSLDHRFSDFSNSRIPMPAIPLTGGTPADAITLLGIGLLVLSLFGAWLNRRRRARLASASPLDDTALL